MSAAAPSASRRIAAGLVAAVHHVATSAPVLAGLAGSAGLAALDGQVTAFAVLAAAGAVLCAEGVRADLTGRSFPTCPLCALNRRGTRKETTK